MAQVSIAFEAWKEGHVAPNQQQLSIVAPKPGPKLEPVSSRLKQELIHPNRNTTLWETRFSPDGKRILAGDYPEGVVVVWDVSSGKQLTAIETGYAYRGGGEFFSVSPDWQTLFVSREKRKIERVEKDSKRLLKWTFDGEVRQWNLNTGKQIRVYKHDPPRNIIWTQLSPDGKKLITYDELPGIYNGSAKRATSIWEVQTGKFFQLPDGLQSGGKFSKDGQKIATNTVDDEGYAHDLKVFDLVTGTETLSIPIQQARVWVSIRGFSPDGRMVVGTYQVFKEAKKWDNYQSCLKWWDTATGKEVASFALKPNEGFGYAGFSPDGRILVVNQNQNEGAQLILYSVRDKTPQHTVLLGKKTTEGRVLMRQPVFSPDGKWLAVITQVFPESPSGSEPDVQDVPQARIHLIEVASGEIRETLISSPAFTIACFFSPDGKTLATGGLGRVLLWDVADLADQAEGVRER